MTRFEYLVKPSHPSHIPTYEDGTDRVFRNVQVAYKIKTPGNYPEESTRHSEHGESLKSRKCICDCCLFIL